MIVTMVDISRSRVTGDRYPMASAQWKLYVIGNKPIEQWAIIPGNWVAG